MTPWSTLYKIAVSKINGLDPDLPYFNGTVVPYVKKKSIGNMGSISQPERYSRDSISAIDVYPANLANDIADAMASRSPDGTYKVTVREGLVRPNEQVAHEFRHAMHDSDGSGGNRTQREDSTLDKAYGLASDAVRMVYGRDVSDAEARRIAREEQGAVNAEYQWRAYANMRDRNGRRPSPEEFVSGIKNMSPEELRALRTSFGGSTSVYEKLTTSMPRLRKIIGSRAVDASPGQVADVLWRNDSGSTGEEQRVGIEQARGEVDGLYRDVNENPWKGVQFTDEQLEEFRKALLTAQNKSIRTRFQSLV